MVSAGTLEGVRCFFLEIPEGRGDVFKKLKRVVKWFG